VNELKDNINSDCVLTLVGNKIDLRHLRAVAFDEAAQYAGIHSHAYHARYIGIYHSHDLFLKMRME
jgi:hypothetical protein